MTTSNQTPDAPGTSRNFSDLAAEPQRGVLAELGGFLIMTRKWWLIPVLLALGIAAVMVVLGSSAAAPFIYTIF